MAKWHAGICVEGRTNSRRKPAEGAKISKRGKMVKLVFLSIFGAKFANTEARGGKTSWAIGRLANSRRKPAEGDKMGKNGKLAKPVGSAI